MDNIDLKLLRAMQQNSRTSIQDLAMEAGTSTASVQRRLKGLRQLGIIEKEVALLSPEKLDLGLTAIVAVELERDRLDQIEAFKRKARNDNQVTHFYCIAGETDFIMIVMAKDIADYEAFTYRFFFSDKNVRKFKTSIVISTEKRTSEIPI